MGGNGQSVIIRRAGRNGRKKTATVVWLKCGDNKIKGSAIHLGLRHFVPWPSTAMSAATSSLALLCIFSPLVIFNQVFSSTANDPTIIWNKTLGYRCINTAKLTCGLTKEVKYTPLSRGEVHGAALNPLLILLINTSREKDYWSFLKCFRSSYRWCSKLSFNSCIPAHTRGYFSVF